jgi:formylglycine-generating enzyme required for sulfatase activity
MKRQGVALPDRRVELYQRYVETLLKHWNLARSLAGRPAKDLDLLDTLRILQPLALWMHETSPGVGLVKEGDLHRQLEAIFSERGESDPEKAARRFLEDVRAHTSLLLDRGGRQYGFIHLTFQEYLAAAALAQKGQQEVGPIVDAMAAHVGEAPWHEVSLLTLGYLGLVQQRDQAAGAVVDELLRRAPGPSGEAAVLAGRAVAEMGPGGIPAVCRERVVEALLATMRDSQKVPAPIRVAAGTALADVGDTRPEVVTVDGMQFCWVPAGPFLMGSGQEEQDAEDWEKPQHECGLPYGCWMARYPVTVAQFREFRDHPYGRKNEPVVVVPWYDAVAFCEWLTEKWWKVGRLLEGWRVQLPSEAEWEKARGGLVIPSEPVVAFSREPPGSIKCKDNRAPGRRFPWGEQADANRANQRDTGIGKASAVGCFPAGASAYGCEELSGNVWEWTRSLWGKDFSKPHFLYPYFANYGREDLQASSRVLRVWRGGSFNDVSPLVRCAGRYRFDPLVRYDFIGFRVVLSPFPL